MRGLDNKVALVTGGSGAIGRSICRRFAEEGMHIGIFDIDEESALETVQLVESSGGASEVCWNSENNLSLTGAAHLVFEGKYYKEKL